MSDLTEIRARFEGLQRPTGVAMDLIDRMSRCTKDVPVLLDRLEPLEEFARWIVSLDDPEGPGFEARKSVSMGQIIGKAREALALPEE